MPRRYRGHDLIWWLAEIGLDRTPVEKRATDATLPLITGAYGGHTIDFRAFAHQGITLLGQLQSGADELWSLPTIWIRASATGMLPTMLSSTWWTHMWSTRK